VDQLRTGLRRNMPHQVRVATLWKHTNPKAPDPDYFLHEVNQWVVLPYEMRGISEDQLRTHKPFLQDMLSP
ncbi:MAG: hypoxanthine phosphoribosyltransferase, partial [Pseudomonadota bacterium]|nr:hypoxanthine phosphoribosyltransferase [Pseudomonadota bacterium]